MFLTCCSKYWRGARRVIWVELDVEEFQGAVSLSSRSAGGDITYLGLLGDRPLDTVAHFERKTRSATWESPTRSVCLILKMPLQVDAPWFVPTQKPKERRVSTPPGR